MWELSGAQNLCETFLNFMITFILFSFLDFCKHPSNDERIRQLIIRLSHPS